MLESHEWQGNTGIIPMSLHWSPFRPGSTAVIHHLAALWFSLGWGHCRALLGDPQGWEAQTALEWGRRKGAAPSRARHGKNGGTANRGCRARWKHQEGKMRRWRWGGVGNYHPPDLLTVYPCKPPFSPAAAGDRASASLCQLRPAPVQGPGMSLGQHHSAGVPAGLQTLGEHSTAPSSHILQQHEVTSAWPGAGRQDTPCMQPGLLQTPPGSCRRRGLLQLIYKLNFTLCAPESGTGAAGSTLPLRICPPHSWMTLGAKLGAKPHHSLNDGAEDHKEHEGWRVGSENPSRL